MLHVFFLKSKVYKSTLDPDKYEKENKESNAREGEDIGDSEVKKDEVLKTLVTLKANAEITLPEIAEHLKLDSLLVSDEQKSNLSAFGKVKALCGESDPVEFVNGLLDEKKANEAKVREAEIDKEFGPEKNPVNGEVNDARVFACSLIGDKGVTAELIAEVKENSLYKKLKAAQADMDSDWNRIGEVDTKENSLDSEKDSVIIV